MADERERKIARRASQGDPDAGLELIHRRVRSGELSPLSHRLPPMERVESWLRLRSVEGVEFEPLDLCDADVGELALRTAEGVRLRWWVPYDDPDHVRTLIRRLVEDLYWADCCRLAIQPVERLQHFECVADLALFRPERLFQSEAALAVMDSEPESVFAAVASAMDSGVAALGETEGEGFLEALTEYATTRAFSIGFGEDNPVPFRERAPKALLPLAEDARLLADLDRSHLGLLERLDEWVNADRVSVSGTVTGRSFNLPVWTTFQSIYGVDSLPERRDTADSPPGLAPRDVPSFQAGALQPLPSRWHGARLCGVAFHELSRDELHLLSWDAAGWLQVSELQGNRELLPMTGIRGHAPGELCCCWIGDRAFVSAGSEGKVVRWGLNGRELSDELLLTHEQGVTALVQLDGETLAFGDARGAVYVAGASGAKPRRLASTAERGGVRQLIVFGERLIARLESGLVAWDVGPGAGGEPAWERSVVTVAATASPAGRLALALQAGGAEEIDVGSGEPVGPLPCPTPDRLLSLHFASTEDPEPEATVWIWPRGPILIDGPGRTTGIVNDPLEATTVSFRCRCVAYADIGHRLHVLPWNA